MRKSGHKRSLEEVTALSTYVKLMRAAESLTARIHRNVAEVGVTISQFGTLEALYYLGPMTQVEIGMKILKSSGNMTMVIDNLENPWRWTGAASTLSVRALMSGSTPGSLLIREAMKAKEEGKQKVILFNWSGHGLVDLAAYSAYMEGKLQDFDLSDAEIERALRDIADFPKVKR